MSDSAAESAKNFASRIGTLVRQHGVEVAQPPQGDWTQAVAAARCWAQAGDSFFPVTEVVNELPAGAYRCRMSNSGPYLEKMAIEFDHLLALPDSAVESLITEFKQFWTLRENFAERGFTFKRGMMLWGPPGGGKTSAIWQMTQELVKTHNGIVIFVEDANLTTGCISILRRIEPDRPLICVMEDLDALVQRQGDHAFLALLDGETQVSNVIHIATTNYPEHLDCRFVDRPSRFDTIMHVGMPTADARRVYLKAKEPSLDDVTLQRWVARTEDYSIAHLREVIIATKCFGQPDAEVFARLDAMRDGGLSSDGHGGMKRETGFIRGAMIGRG